MAGATLAGLACQPADRAHAPSAISQAASSSARATPSPPAIDCRAVDSMATKLQVTAECIGPLAVHANLGALRASSPASDTGWHGEPGSHPFAAWQFTPRGLVVVATQFGTSVSAAAPAERWMVRAGPGVLPDSLPLNSTWGELRRRYGWPAFLGGSWTVDAEFCSHPGLIFTLDSDLDPTSVKAADLSDSTRVESVMIGATTLAGSCSTTSN